MPDKLTAAEFRAIGERLQSSLHAMRDRARLYAAIERLVVESSDGTIFAIRMPGRLFYKSADAALDALLGVNEHET